MDLIKTTPDEIYDLEYEANALAELSTNPGIKDFVMLELAKKVIRETRGLSYKQQIKELEYLARKSYDASKAVTERIEKVKETSHNIIGGAHHFIGYEAPERPVQSEQYEPHDDDPSAA